MSSTDDSQPKSANVESFNHSSGTSFSQSKINTIGRDLHEIHNHNHHYHAVGRSGSWQVPTFSDTLGRVWQGIVESFSEFGSTERVPREAIDTLDYELHHRKTYRVYSAKYKQHFSVVKVFHGQRAKQIFKKAVKWNKQLFHPSILNMIAVSSRNCDTPFIVFDSDGETGSVEVRIASALTAGLPRSIRLGFEIVGGLSAALDYLADNGVPCASLGPDNFELYITQEDQIKIGMDLNEVGNISDVQNNDDALWELLNILCIKTFRDANHRLYDDEQFDEGDPSINEITGLRENGIESSSRTTNSLPSETSQPTAAEPSSSFPPRRELSWKRSQRGSKTISLVARQYKDRLRPNAGHPYGNSLQLRRLRGGPRRPLIHRCQGYRKEQITLTSNVADAALILHTSPFPGEQCLVCGEVVKDKEHFQCICGQPDDGFSSTIKCTVCRLWQHRRCVWSDTDPRHFVCSYCRSPAASIYTRHHEDASAAANDVSADPRSLTDPYNSKTYSFIALPGNTVQKRPRRRYNELERLYQCSWPDCTKTYATLNHLNAHVTMQKHGPKRSPDEFKEMRKQWRKQKKEQAAALAADQASLARRASMGSLSGEDLHNQRFPYSPTSSIPRGNRYPGDDHWSDDYSRPRYDSSWGSGYHSPWDTGYDSSWRRSSARPSLPLPGYPRYD
ncbi:hypothetical protein VKT23_015634 [Stygiomarasmius scandens]|uniref:C2H2-type domain-containing protein n=1 Tax=Marasmiellus scandens TaxID=2682957 RepID=A0ABR1J1C0_9AGAR